MVTVALKACKPSNRISIDFSNWFRVAAGRLGCTNSVPRQARTIGVAQGLRLRPVQASRHLCVVSFIPAELLLAIIPSFYFQLQVEFQPCNTVLLSLITVSLTNAPLSRLNATLRYVLTGPELNATNSSVAIAVYESLRLHPSQRKPVRFRWRRRMDTCCALRDMQLKTAPRSPRALYPIVSRDVVMTPVPVRGLSPPRQAYPWAFFSLIC